MSFCAVPYPYKEFAAHFSALEIVRQYEYINRGDNIIHIGKDSSVELDTQRVHDYMLQHNPKEIAFEKAAVFCKMVSFISRHLSEFDRGTLAVRGKANGGMSLVSEKLLRAVYHVFMELSDEEMNSHGPSVEKVIQLAETIYKDEK